MLTLRRCFWINVPLGGFTLFVIAILLPNPKSEETSRVTWRQQIARLDLGGTAIFVPSIVCLLLALQYGGNRYNWDDARVIILLTLFALLILCFIAYETWMKVNAAVPLRVLRLKNVAYGSWFVFCLDGTFYVFNYYVSSQTFP